MSASAGDQAGVIRAPRVLAGDRVLSPGWVRIDTGRIVAVGAGAPSARPTGSDIVLPDGWLVPGFVDLQMNGGYGADFSTASDDAWLHVLRRLPASGVTTVTPTLITAPLDDLVAGLHNFRRLRRRLDATPGTTRTTGMHLEGPFLADARRGAHHAAWLCDPTAARVDQLLEAGRDGALAYVTLAPERAHALDAIGRLTAAGVRVAVGHSDADDDRVLRAFDVGATLVTHLYNAQRALHHRDPGVVGAALSDPRCVCGLIVDLHHVAATAVRVAFAAAGGRIALVTDAVAALGMPPGHYQVGHEPVHVAAGGQVPRRDDGTVAGSVLRMDAAVVNVVACGIDIPTAVTAATRVPADALGCTDRGRIAVGAVADLVWLSDDLTVDATWIGGRPCHAQHGAVGTGPRST